MAKRLAELGALQDAVSNSESNPSRLGLAGYIRGLFLDWSANPYNPLTRLSARGRLLGYFWDNGAVGLSMDFANQSFIVKDGTLQSKPFSDIVNFSRTTNATVTNSAGVITYAPHNLLLASEQFDSSSWVNNASSEQSNVILSPNNTITADKLIEDSTTDVHTTTQTLTKVASVITYTYSIYVKGGLGRNVQLSLDGGTTTNRSTANFDIANGVVGSVLNFGTFTAGSNQIEALSNNWYRCSLTTTTGTETSIRARATLLNGTTSSYAGDGTSGIYLWGAQLEIGSTATTYNPTTVKNLLGYSELFDNAAWTKSNSFVQTNLLTYSEAFDNAAWSKTTVTATANSIAAPNGYQTADTLLATGANSTALQTFTASAVPYTFSVYLYRKTGTGNIDITVDGTTWVTKTITAGWTRVDTTLTPTAGSKTAGIRIATNGDEVYAWGAQLVQGSVAGDYRRTDAAALPVYYPNHNGVVCAELVVENTSAAYHQVTATSVGGGTTNTMSMYAKQYSSGSKRWLYMYPQPATGSAFAIFDLTLGTVTATGNGGTATYISSSITPVGNGWYRCSITFTGVAGNVICQYGLSNSSTTAATYTGDGTSGIYVFGTQLSDSASLDPYVLNAAAAPTAAAYYGARFDYDPVTLAPKGLLIEEQRANLLLNSSIAGTNLATQNVTVTAVAHTLSFYGTGTVTLTGTANTSLVGTGAYPTRSTLTFTPTAGVVLFTVTGTVQYAQLEIGSFATSFIPTAASQVTRTVDVASIQGSNFYSWFNQNAGSVYSQFVTPASGNRNIISLDDNTANNNIRLRTEGTDPYLKQAWVGTEQVALDLGTVAANTEYKISAAYQINDYAGVIANGTVGTDTVANTSIMVMLRLGTDQAGAYLNGTIKSLSYYPTRLNNDTLKGLTA